MAFIGMRYPVVAKLKAHTAGSMPTYEQGMVVGRAIQGNLTITRNNNPLYADDAEAENDNGVTAMSLETGLDDVTEEVEAYMLGLEEAEAAEIDGAEKTYYETDAAAPDVGMGYIRVRKMRGVVSYQAVWYFKGQAGINSKNTQTKGETIAWQTPTVSTRFEAIDVDGKGTQKFRMKVPFDSFENAKKWLDKMANIQASEAIAAKSKTPVAKV